MSNNLAFGLRDIYKKYGTSMESAYVALGNMMTSEFSKIRMITIQMISEMIMNESAQLNGIILFHVMHAITDEEKIISTAAKKLLLSYMETKNSSLIRDILLDTIFIINGYTVSCLNVTEGPDSRGLDSEGLKIIFLYKFKVNERQPIVFSAPLRPPKLNI